MYRVKISNLVHTYFNINVTSQRKISSTPSIGLSRTALTALLSQDNGLKASTGLEPATL